MATQDGGPFLDEIEIRFVPNSAVRVGSLSSDQVAVATGIPPKDVENLVGSGYTLLSADRPGAPYSVYLNSQSAQWGDVRVRQAFHKSLDVGAIVDALYLGYYKRAWSPLSQPTVGYDPTLENAWGQDLDAANALLDEAGWTMNGD